MPTPAVHRQLPKADAQWGRLVRPLQAQGAWFPVPFQAWSYTQEEEEQDSPASVGVLPCGQRCWVSYWKIRKKKLTVPVPCHTVPGHPA